MLIEQIIEFELSFFRDITIYFHDKAKISLENLRVDYYLVLKYCRRQCSFLSST